MITNRDLQHFKQGTKLFYWKETKIGFFKKIIYLVLTVNKYNNIWMMIYVILLLGKIYSQYFDEWHGQVWVFLFPSKDLALFDSQLSILLTGNQYLSKKKPAQKTRLKICRSTHGTIV